MLRYRNSRLQGPYQYFFPGGGLDVDGYFDGPQGERGPVRHYYPGGGLKLVEAVRAGQATGPVVTYHANGRVKYRGLQRNKNYQGWFTLIDSLGVDSTRVRFENGCVVKGSFSRSHL